MSSPAMHDAELLLLLREQVILAQVRIMELEDQRDELTPQVAHLTTQVEEAQRLVDRTVEENTHLRRVQEDQLNQLQHQRHLVHVAHEALTETRRRIDEVQAELAELSRRHEALASQRDQLAATLAATADQARLLETELAATRQVVDQQAGRIQELDAERQAMRASRSWRWTAWLRALERRLGRQRAS